MSPPREYVRAPGTTPAGVGWGRSAGMRCEVSERTSKIPVASNTMTPTAPARIRRLRCLRSRRPSNRSKSPSSRSTVRLSRSRMSAILGIVDLHHPAERVAPVARERADRRARDAERIPRLVGCEPEHLGQYERGSLPRRECGEDMADDMPVVGIGEVVVRWRESDGPAEREHGSPGPLAGEGYR